MTRLDIRELMAEIAEITGVDLATITRIVFEPDTLKITRLLRNDDGKFYLGVDDLGREGAATETLTFELRT